ncbi:MAG: discoidin domain-containing protein [Thermoanaerobaculia bacterium]|nr:discoidin domain-containing protein [Thermoanaerobaculia bacterium]
MSSRAAERLARALGLALLLACGIAAGCKEEPPAKTEPVRHALWFPDDPKELLTPARGVVVVDRSGELSFEGSTLSAIDGDPTTAWLSPPKDLEQWVVFEFSARSRITRVGASTDRVSPSSRSVAKLRFEGSLDGETFREIGTVDVERGKDDQTFEVPPSEVRFLRVTTLENHGDESTNAVPTLLAKGEELEQPAPPRFAGRWQVYDWTVDLSQEGSALYGVAQMDPPMIFYGAVDGRVARLVWSRGNESGVAWFTVNPSSTRLSGLWWWIGPVQDPWFGEAWYGERRGDAPLFRTPIPQIADVHLKKSGKMPLYGLVFRPDGELDVEASRSAIEFIGEALRAFPSYRVRLEVLNCSTWDEAKNLASSRDRAAKLSAALVRAGLPKERLIIESTSRTDRISLMLRLLFSRVDFSLAGN